MPEPEADLSLLTEAAMAAGVIAMRYFGQSPKQWDKPDGAGPVTEADLAVDGMLRERLLAARPGLGWLSEETRDTGARLKTPDVFIVDPIDGTRAYIAGDTAWAHSLALVRDGRVTAAVVYLPAKDLLYTATAYAPARLNGAPIHASGGRDPATARVLTSARSLAPDRWPGGVPPVTRHFRPSLAWRLALVAEGRFDAMLTLDDAWEWDVAAGCLIAECAGATVTGRDGVRPRFNAPHPKTRGLVVAPPALHAALMARLSPSGRAEPARTV